MFLDVITGLPKNLQLECYGQLLEKISMHMPLATIDKILARAEYCCRSEPLRGRITTSVPEKILYSHRHAHDSSSSSFLYHHVPGV